MKTIFHSNIDGYEVALGIGEAFGLIDPVATAVKIAALLPALDECKQLMALNAQINAGRQDAGAEFFQAEQARQRHGPGPPTRKAPTDFLRRRSCHQRRAS